MSLKLETVDLQWESKNKVAGIVQPVSREGHALIYSQDSQSLFLIGGKNFEFLTEIFELKIDTF